MKNIADFNWKTLSGEEFKGAQLLGKRTIIFNTASACGYTPQLGQFEELHREMGAAGVQILAFPCNDFGAQEPGSPEEIQSFCERQYNVTFPLMEKIEITQNTHPLFAWMQEQSNDSIKWNFHKFVLNEKGEVVGSFAHSVSPMDDGILNLIKV